MSACQKFIGQVTGRCLSLIHTHSRTHTQASLSTSVCVCVCVWVCALVCWHCCCLTTLITFVIIRTFSYQRGCRLVFSSPFCLLFVLAHLLSLLTLLSMSLSPLPSRCALNSWRSLRWPPSCAALSLSLHCSCLFLLITRHGRGASKQREIYLQYCLLLLCESKLNHY